MTLLRYLIIAVALLGVAPRAQALAELAADINLGITGRIDGDPRNFARLGNVSYFSACDRAHGCELWQTDGTSAGTVLLADLCPGPCSSRPSSLGITFGSTLYFAADDGTHGSEPWQYRPELGAPRLVGDVNPGALGSSPFGFTSITSTNLAGVFFAATIGNGSQSNTIMRASEGGNSVFASPAIAPGSISSIGAMVVLSDKIYFRALAATGNTGTELYTLSANAPGSFQLTLMRDILPGVGGSTIDFLTPVPALGRVFFRANDSSGNTELWRSDGTPAGTVLVKDIRTTGGSFPQDLTAMGNRLYFSADDATGATGNNRELWVSDGTTAGTVKILEIAAGVGNADPRHLRVLGNRVLFIANDGTTGMEFYSSDGTAAGTARLTDLIAGSGGFITTTNDPDAAVVVGGFYYLGSETRLFRTDGTASGSRQVGATINDAIIGIDSLHASANGVLFSVLTFAEGRELYGSRVDTPNQAGILRVIGDQIGHSDPRYFHDLPGGRIVLAYDDVEGFEWRRLAPDGSASLLVSLVEGNNTYLPLSDVPVRSTAGEDRLWFINDFNELWVTDGSAAGTRRVFDFASLPISPGNISCLAARGSEVIVLLRNFSPDRRELWLSDGTSEGTRALITPENLPFDVELEDMFCPLAAGSAILVSATSPGTGREMFRSNGTAGNLTLLRDIAPGQTSTIPNELISSGALAYFSVSDEVNSANVELWRSDGTAQGTFKLREINPSGSSNARNFVPFGNDLLFVANDGSSGNELYRTDGTGAGTARVIDLFAGAGSAFGSFFSDGPDVVVDSLGRIFLSAVGDGSGRDLYVSDGTDVGTRRIAPSGAVQSIQPQGLVALTDGGVLFAGHQPASGRELWFSDGSDDGSFLLTDIVPGAEGGGPQQLAATADGALFTAIDATHGQEPWRVVLSQTPAIFADGFE